MLENLYTTKMNSDKKTLQLRFSKIRSKGGRLSKLMAAVMSVAIVVTMLGATVVMAAVGSDGLEYWDKNEIYFRDGVSFSVNVSGRDVPAWVYDGIAGSDGNIDITVKNYERRSTRGTVSLYMMAEISGSEGSASLACPTGGGFNSTQFLSFGSEQRNSFAKSYPYCTQYRFIELTDDRGFADFWSPFAGLMNNRPEQRKYVNVVLLANENKNFVNGYVDLFTAAEEDSEEVTDHYRAPVMINADSISFIGDYESNLTDTKKSQAANEYFTSFETAYENIATDKVNISVGGINQESMAVNVSTSLENAAKTNIYIYDENNYHASFMSSDLCTDRQYIMRPGELMRISSDGTEEIYTLGFAAPDFTYSFQSGKTYKMQVILLDENRTVLYRWQEYVTVQ